MTYETWQLRLAVLTTAVDETRFVYERACEERNKFLKDTLGVMPGETATIEDTVTMVAKILDMKLVEK